MLTQYFIVSAIILFLYMTAWFLVGKHRNRLNVVDVAWGGGFVVLAWSMYIQNQGARNLLIALLVSVWGLRLIRHLYRRVIVGGEEDPRYEALRAKWKGNRVWLRAYLSIFLLQGLLILVVGLPIVVAGNETARSSAWFLVAGTAVWLIGLVIESFADAQLARFVANRTDKNAIMDKGLWHYSRHPNYFGELLQWWGIGIIALQADRGWSGLFGPLVLTLLIVFVSGIPPIEKRKKSSPAYAEYMRHTSVLIPLPKKS